MTTTKTTTSATTTTAPPGPPPIDYLVCAGDALYTDGNGSFFREDPMGLLQQVLNVPAQEQADAEPVADWHANKASMPLPVPPVDFATLPVGEQIYIDDSGADYWHWDTVKGGLVEVNNVPIGHPTRPVEESPLYAQQYQPQQRTMTPEEIIAQFLDADDLTANVDADVEEIIPSDTALYMDLWGLDQGREIAEQEWAKKATLSPFAVADFHQVCFTSEILFERAPKPEHQIRAKWMEALVQTPALQSLRSNTIMDADLSELGSQAIGEKFADYYSKLTPEEKQAIEGNEAESLAAQAKRTRSVQSAVTNAQTQVNGNAAVKKALGITPAHNVPKATIARIFQIIKKNPSVRRIMELAGAYIAKAAECQHRKKIHGLDDVVGIKLDDKIPLLIPSEAMKLVSHRGLKLDALRRIVEHQAMCRELQATQPMLRGPVCFCFDESGSMSGERNEHAKAIGLAMAWIATHQNRWFSFCSFADGKNGRFLAVPPGQPQPDLVLDYLAGFICGGTTLDVPLETLPFQYWDQMGSPKGKTDLVIITDACVSADHQMVQRFNQWKRDQPCKVYGVVIGYDEPGCMSAFCDQVFVDRQLGIDNDSTSQIMSI